MEVLGGRYELIECIGQGGFGAVWRARDGKLQRDVAVKRLWVEGDIQRREQLLARIEQEAIVTAQIDHPNIVTIHDVARVEGKPEIYLVMELLAGRTLEDVLAGPTTLAPERAVNLFVGVLRGLGAAHERGIVHKDLKPENLFLIRPGTDRELLKVIDFGVARTNAEGLTQAGRLVGTPAYFAPEYIASNDVTPRVDVYQMGLVLALSLSGSRPLPHGLSSSEYCKRHIRGELSFPPELRESALWPVIRQATAKDPNQRYPDCAAFAEALESMRATVETELSFPEDAGPTLVIDHPDSNEPALLIEDTDDASAPAPSNSSSLEEKLLTGDGKWWEFLDPETYEPTQQPSANRTSSDRLDWSRVPERHRAGPVGFAFFNHCSDCGQGVPPDFTFCVHCGGAPRSNRGRQTFSLLIKAFDDDQAERAAAELIVGSGVGLESDEVARILQKPPAVFNIVASRDQVAALTAKLAEVGIRAKGFAVDDPSVPWIGETFESIVRQPVKLLAFAALSLVAVVGWFATWWFGVIGCVALVGFFVRELVWYQNHYALQVDRLLELVTGFDHDTAMMARETLRSMADREARSYVTLCLMEYYSLTQQIRAHAALYGDILVGAKRALEELMADVLRLAHRYARMDEFVAQHPPAQLQQKIGRLQDALPSDPVARELSERQISVLREQLETVQRMEASRESFRERLGALSSSMESIRHRIAAVRVHPSEDAWREMHMEEALNELEDEFEIFEETFAAVQV